MAAFGQVDGRPFNDGNCRFLASSNIQLFSGQQDGLIKEKQSNQ